ncbi:DUF736 family protein [Bradyrhizobium canariense]|uniref:DUF736 family protein n=1 Tax=Bradyrhizobium canariense TaxID=255045 RepID=UPI003CC7D492
MERSAPLHCSYAGQTEIGRARLKRSEAKRCYFSLKLDDPSFNCRPVRSCSTDDGDEASPLVRGGCENWFRRILHHPGRPTGGSCEHGQACPCRTADANRTSASEGLTPSQRRHPDLRQGKRHMIAAIAAGTANAVAIAMRKAKDRVIATAT